MPQFTALLELVIDGNLQWLLPAFRLARKLRSFIEQVRLQC